MLTIDPYLNFDGNAAEAFRFYEQVLGGKIKMLQTHGESPIADQVPKEFHNRVIHVALQLGDRLLMASDSPPGKHQPMQGMYVSINVDTLADGKRIFDALSKGGNVQMPFEKQFWAEGFGMCIDRFGTPWMVNVGGASQS